MKGHGTKYPRKKEQAIVALLSQSSMGEAAQVAGVSETTLWRWLQEEEFSQSYREARRRVVEQAISRVQQSSGKAVTTLAEMMTDQDAPPSTRVTAARVILEMTVKFVEIEDLRDRVAKLERLVSESIDSLNGKKQWI